MDIATLLRSNTVSEDHSRIQSVRSRLFGRKPRIAPSYLEVHRKIGGGTFGEVYLATDHRHERRVALKVIRFHGPVERARLDHEARGQARLSHPNIVQIHDSGEIDRGVFFLVLEYIEGQTLDEWIEARTRSLAEILEVFLQLAKGLLHAHRRSLVHRDFKAKNVMVDRDGTPKVLDFGLAKLTQEGREQIRRAQLELRGPTDEEQPVHGATHSPPRAVAQAATQAPSGDREALEDLGWSLTGSKGFVGTVYYAAPEQLQSQYVDARGDQFSFCVTLFEACYGFHPFGAHGSTRPPNRLELLRRIRDRELAKERPIRAIPRWLRSLLLRGLQPDPDDRHEDLEAIIEILEARLHPPPRRTWHVALGAGIALTALTIMSAGAWIGRDRLQWDDHDSWAAGSWTATAAELERSYGSLPRRLRQFPQEWQAAADELDARWLPWHRLDAQRQCLRDSRAAFGDEIGLLLDHHDPQPTSSLLPPTVHVRSARLLPPERCLTDEASRAPADVVEPFLLAREQHIRGENDEALDTLERVRDQLGPDDRSLRGLVELSRAEVLMTMRDPAAWDATAAAAYATGADLELQVEAVLRQAEVGVMLDRDPAQIEELLARAEAWERALRGGGPEDSSTLARLSVLRHLSEGRLAVSRGDHLAAIDAYERALVDLADLAGSTEQTRRTRATDPTVAYVELQIGAAMAKVDGLRMEAATRVVRAIDALRSGLGDDHPLVPLYTLQGGNALVAAGDLRSARTHFESTIALTEHIGGDARLQRIQAEAELLYVDLRYEPEGPGSRPPAVLDRARTLRADLEAMTLAGDLPGDLARVWYVVALAFDKAGAPTRALEAVPPWLASATRDRDRQRACLAFADLREQLAEPREGAEPHARGDARFREIFLDLETECS